LHTPHAWFVVQSLVVVIMVLVSGAISGRRIPGFINETRTTRSWSLVIPAGIIIGLAEAAQAFSLGSGQQLVVIETLLGSYPAVYFLIANKIFKEPIRIRQGIGVAVTAVAIALLSTGIATKI
jgi:drug/metabolite transporter (DMT)-like permease